MFIGCCWASVAAAAVEALYTSLDPNEKIVQLSPQKLLDCCVPKPDPKKCDEMGYNYHFNKAFKWIVDHGISTRGLSFSIGKRRLQTKRYGNVYVF